MSWYMTDLCVATVKTEIDLVYTETKDGYRQKMHTMFHQDDQPTLNAYGFRIKWQQSDLEVQDARMHELRGFATSTTKEHITKRHNGTQPKATPGWSTTTPLYWATFTAAPDIEPSGLSSKEKAGIGLGVTGGTLFFFICAVLIWHSRRTNPQREKSDARDADTPPPYSERDSSEVNAAAGDEELPQYSRRVEGGSSTVEWQSEPLGVPGTGEQRR